MEQNKKYDPEKSKDVTAFAKGAFWIMCAVLCLIIYLMKMFNLHGMGEMSYWIVFSPILTPIGLGLIYIVVIMIYLILYTLIAPKLRERKFKNKRNG